MTQNNNPKRTGRAGLIITSLLLLAGWVLVFLARWVFTTWAGLRMDELIFQLKAPLEGTGDGIILKGVLSSTLPALELTGVFLVIYYCASKKDRGKPVLICGGILSLLLIVGAASFAWKRLELQLYQESDGRLQLYRRPLCRSR